MSAPTTPRPTAADVLRTALELIPDEEHWLQGAYAEADGERIREKAELYAAYDAGRLDRCCAEAALLLAFRRLNVSVVHFSSPYWLLCDQIGSFNLSLANDSPHTTYAWISAAFRRAIAVAEAAEGREP